MVWRIVVALIAGLIAVGVAALGSSGAQPSAPDLGESVVIVPNVADADARRDDSATELVTEDDDRAGPGKPDGDGDDTPVTDGKASWITRVGDTTAGDPLAEPTTAPSRVSAASAPSRASAVTAPSRDDTGA